MLILIVTDTHESSYCSVETEVWNVWGVTKIALLLIVCEVFVLQLLTYSRPGKPTLMFALLILPEKLPHLEVYEQALADKSKQQHSLHWGLSRFPGLLFVFFFVLLAHWMDERSPCSSSVLKSLPPPLRNNLPPLNTSVSATEIREQPW